MDDERLTTRPTTRPLTLPHATALVVASMVGTGVFTTTGFMLADLRSPLLALGVWVLAGLLALAGAAVYAELGAMMPRAGGEYVYLSRAFHPAVGFLSGWISMLVGFAAPTAAAALAFGRYVQTLLPDVPLKPAALILVAVTTVLHLRDVRRGGAVQAVLTGLVLALILAFIGAAFGSGRAVWGRLLVTAEPRPGLGAVAVSLVYVAYSYFGWNAAAYVAGEIRDPDRTLPRALVGGTAAVTVLYVALNAVFLAAAPVPVLAGKVEIARVAARALLGHGGATVIAALVALALAGSVSALCMTGPRVVQAMAEDGQFFRVLARKGKGGAPTAAVLLQGVLAAFGIVTTAFEPLLIYAGFTLTLSAAATVAGAFVLRRREPGATRPHRALGWPFSGVAYLALAAFMTVFAVRERPTESLAGLATLLAGALAWLMWKRRGQAAANRTRKG